VIKAECVNGYLGWVDNPIIWLKPAEDGKRVVFEESVE